MIEQIEFVSHHFDYTEEYVLDHSPQWIERKYMQAIRTNHEKHRLDIMTGFKSMSMIADALLNKGKDANKILPPPFDEALKMNNQEAESNSQFIEGQWWLK